MMTLNTPNPLPCRQKEKISARLRSFPTEAALLDVMEEQVMMSKTVSARPGMPLECSTMFGGPSNTAQRPS